MSEFDQRPPDVAAPVPPVPVPEVPIPVPAVPIPSIPVPSVPTSLEAHATAHGYLAEDVPVDATGHAGVGLDGAHVEGTGIVGDPNTSHLRVQAGANTQDGAYLQGDARVGDPTNHIDVDATTDNGGSIRANASAVDDQYAVDASGGVNQLGSNPTGDFRVDVRANPVPGANLGISGGAQHLGQPDASGDAQAYARIPIGDRAQITANGGIAAGPDGVTYRGGVALDAQVTDGIHVGANAQVSDADGDGRPDYAVRANAGGEF